MDKTIQRKIKKVREKELAKNVLYSQCNDVQCWSPENRWSMYNQYLSKCRC